MARIHIWSVKICGSLQAEILETNYRLEQKFLDIFSGAQMYV